MRFVHLLCKGDLRQWFEKLGAKNGALDKGAIGEFVTSFCRAMSIDEPKEEIAELVELVQEFKFHDFVQLALLISKPLRALGRLELDEELLADGEESTSEAGEDSDEEAADKEDEEKKKREEPQKSAAQPPALQRIQSRLRAGSIRKEGVLQYVNFVTKKDTRDWFVMAAGAPEAAVVAAVARPFLESLAGVLRLKEWKGPLDEMMDNLGEIRYSEFVQLFLGMSRASRESSDLKIDDELAEEEGCSTSEGSENDAPHLPEPVVEAKAKGAKGGAKGASVARVVEQVWCPPYVEGQRRGIQDLLAENVSAILSYLCTKDLLQCLVVCKAWHKAVQRFPPYQWTFACLYHTPSDLQLFKQRHRLLHTLTFMRQYNSDAVEPVLRLFTNLEHLRLTTHPAPKFVGELASLKSLQCEGRIPAVLLKHLATSCHRTLTSLNLSRDFTLSEEERLVPGMTFIKEFSKLRELDLQGCKGDGLNYILQNCAMIRSLNLGFMLISNIHCQLIGGNMFHLRSLVLRSTDVTDDGLYEIGLGCKKLEKVFLENCKKIGAQGVVDLIANCTQITALKLAGCSQLKDDTVFALSGARNLQELDVQMLELVTPKAWYILASKCVHIRIFHAWGCALTEEVLTKFHRRCIIYHALTARNTRAESIATPDWKNSKARKAGAGLRRPPSGVLKK